MRSALAADAAEGRLASAPIAEWPSENVRRRVAAIPGWVILAAVCAAAVVWFLYWGINTHVFQNDEDQYVYLSRWLSEDFPQSLWNFDLYGRGLQRLEVWLLAVPAALFDAPWSLIGGRLLNTIAFVSTAIPVYLLGRGLGLRPRWAALPAAVSVVVPWAVVTTAFLTENVAYPACMWAVWAIWRTAAAPSPWRDATALVLLLVAGLARTGLLLLAPVLPAALLVTGLRLGTGGILARLRTVLRSHALVWGAVAPRPARPRRGRLRDRRRPGAHPATRRQLFDERRLRAARPAVEAGPALLAGGRGNRVPSGGGRPSMAGDHDRARARAGPVRVRRYGRIGRR